VVIRNRCGRSVPAVGLLYVSVKSAFPGEGFAAKRADASFRRKAGPDAGVSSHVLPEASTVGKRLAALRAQKRAFARVHQPMPVESVLPAKPLSTHAALEPLLLVVGPRMHQQVARPFESLSADLALVRPVVHVRPHVFLQTALVRKHLVAHEARVTTVSHAFAPL